jgi:hypothetical protein
MMHILIKRPSVHQRRAEALIALTVIRVPAYALTLVFFPANAAVLDVVRFLRPGAKAGQLVRCSASGFQLKLLDEIEPSAPGGRRDFLPLDTSSRSLAARPNHFFLVQILQSLCKDGNTHENQSIKPGSGAF